MKEEFDAWWERGDTLTVQWRRVPSFLECRRILEELVKNGMGILVTHILPSGIQLIGFYGDMGRPFWLYVKGAEA